MKFITLIITICLLIFIEYKFEVIDYLRFVNSVKTLEGSSIAYSSDGEMIAVARKFTPSKTSENKKSRGYFQIEIRRVADGFLIKSLDSLTTGNLTFSPDNLMIAAGSYDGKVYVWRISDGELLHSFDYKINVNSSRMRLLSFTQDGQDIVTLISGVLSSSFNQINVWNLANETNRILSGEFVSAELSPDGEILAVANINKTIDLYRLDDLTLVKQLEVNRKPIGTKFSPDGKKIAFIGYSFTTLPGSISDRHIYLHSLEDGSLLNVFYYSTILPKSKESLEKMAISPDGRYLAASYSRSTPSSFFVGAPRGSDARFYGRIRVWRIEDGKQLQTFRGHKRQTTSIVFSPDSKFLVSTGWDGKVRFWRMPPRNYSWFWLFGAGGLATLVYWQRAYLMLWLNW